MKRAEREAALNADLIMAQEPMDIKELTASILNKQENTLNSNNNPSSVAEPGSQIDPEAEKKAYKKKRKLMEQLA